MVDPLLALTVCVVTVLSVPQALPAHPDPPTDQLIIELGFDPATGVRVATRTAVADVETVPGALSCNVKWLVTTIPTEVCLEGSATLCAVSVTEAGDGKICGAT